MLRESEGAVMNLENLNQIANEEKDLLKRAKKLDDYSEYLANRRKSSNSLSGFVRKLNIPDPSYPRYEDIPNAEVMRIVDSMSADVFRAVEMKFAAEARELRIEAKLKNQQLKNFLPDGAVL